MSFFLQMAGVGMLAKQSQDQPVRVSMDRLPCDRVRDLLFSGHPLAELHVSPTPSALPLRSIGAFAGCKVVRAVQHGATLFLYIQLSFQ